MSVIGLCWRNLPFSERDVWECKARIAMAEHKAKYPNYRFKPSQKDKDPTPRRRVKEPPAPPDERRCAEIASLLVCGMKGDELASRVRELDATRPSEGVRMRFDDPVTPTTGVMRVGKATDRSRKRDRAKKDEGEMETDEETQRRPSSAPVPEAPTEVEETKFIPHSPRQPRRSTRVIPARDRAVSASPAKKRTAKPRAAILSISTSRDSKPLPHSLAIFPTRDELRGNGKSGDMVQGDNQGEVLQNGTKAAMEGGEPMNNLQEAFVPSQVDSQYPTHDDSISTPPSMNIYQYWPTSPPGADAGVWTPNSPQQSWTPHSPPVHNLYHDTPLNSPNGGSPFLQAQQQYNVQYTGAVSPGADEQYAAPYTPTSPQYPPATPTSPTEFDHTPTHAPVPRAYLDMNALGQEYYENGMPEMYQYSAEYSAMDGYASYPEGNGDRLMFGGEIGRELELHGHIHLDGLPEYRQAVEDLHMCSGTGMGTDDPALVKGRPCGDDDGLHRHPAAC